MYRNPFTDDPSVKGVSRGTANTHVVFHHGYLFALKEDSPPVAMNPLSLETLDDYYTFGGGLHSLTHTAHPKFDPHTGEMIAYGYEARAEHRRCLRVLANATARSPGRHGSRFPTSA